MMITVDKFYRSLFGGKVYKISLDAGCTCPNRDGTIGYGGCIFCGERGSGDFASSRALPIKEQVEAAKKLVDSKFSRKAARGESVPKKYIAYFQNFTNTYGDLTSLQAKWRAALSCQNLVGLALGTRPDCLSDQCLCLLSQLAEEGYFIQVELGLQTSDDATADYFHRGYKTQVYIEAVRRLHQANPKIHVVTHVLFGLPTGQGSSQSADGGIESSQQMLDSVQTAVSAGTDGIKIANLYVLKDTELSRLYQKGNFRTLEYQEYLSLMQKALALLPAQMVVHRLSGDPPRASLLAPVWCTDKKRIMNDLKKIELKTSQKTSVF